MGSFWLTLDALKRITFTSRIFALVYYAIFIKIQIKRNTMGASLRPGIHNMQHTKKESNQKLYIMEICQKK